METQTEAKFKVGDRVCSKNTGHPMVGMITSAINIEQYCSNIPVVYRFAAIAAYSPLYPDWFKKPIYLVAFEKPQKPYTKEEIKRSLPRNWNFTEEKESEIINLIYDETREISIATYPEDDLEMF